MNEYFSRKNENDIVLISNGVEYRVTFTKIDGIDYFYQYPTKREMEQGQTAPKRRLVSEIKNSQQG